MGKQKSDLSKDKKRENSTLAKTATIGLANQWFTYFALREDLALGYPDDGCFARAHLICSEMAATGLAPKKIWVAKELEGKDSSLGFSFHVAPCLMVTGEDGKEIPMVIDPVFFRHPVSPEEWTKGMDATKFTITELNAPSGHGKGEGYFWYPAAGVKFRKRNNADKHKHAKDTLEEYRRKEIDQKLSRPWLKKIRKGSCLLPNLDFRI